MVSYLKIKYFNSGFRIKIVEDEKSIYRDLWLPDE